MEKLKLLVVDDEEQIRTAIRFFCGNDYDVSEAGNGVEALEVVASQPVDLLISDYNMPRMNGLELLKMLNQRGVMTPIIWLTGRGSSELCRDSWGLGVYDYMEKPFVPEDLLACLSGASDFVRSVAAANQMGIGSKHLFEKAQLMLSARSYRTFQQLCAQQGVSPSTMVEKLIEDYIKASRQNA